MSKQITSTLRSLGVTPWQFILGIACIGSWWATVQPLQVLRGANGQTYVNMPDDFAAALHPEADAAPLAALLQPYENAGHVPAGTTAALVAWVESTRALPTPEERTFVLWNKFPDYFKNLSLTSLPAEALPTETFSMGRR